MGIRVYELSKKLGLSNKEIIELLKKQGISVTSLAVLTPEMQALVENAVKGSTPVAVKAPEKPAVALEKKVPQESSPKAVPRQEAPKKVSQDFPKKTVPAPKKVLGKKAPTSEVEEPQGMAPGTIYLQPMTVATIALQAGVPVSEVIVTLLRKGVASTINQLLPEETVRDLAEVFNLTVLEKAAKDTSAEAPKVADHAEGEWKERLPIVVVIGHVDHGKTTLLDFIRKTRVASREKGGITQHLGAYEVPTKQGSIVFLDTPGHEAFSLMRVRGIKVADIAVVIIAADDGIMPQTTEAINAAKAANIPIVVAINKIDKASPAQVEAVKTQLARFDLVPEEWGGQTIVRPISAKDGTGVDELLEVLVLQAQVMDLKANLTVPARGYVLESKIGKGRGPVATVICQHGILKVGDYFASGEATGRVNSLVDSDGKQLKEVGPSVPVLVAGFSQLAHSGDIFEVFPQKVIRRGTQPPSQRADLLLRKVGSVARESDVDIIIKADNASSREAVVNSLTRLKSKHSLVSVIQSGVGDISESDVMFASDTGARIYGLHVHVQPNAQELIKKYQVVVKTFDIIYKLIEDVEALQEAAKPIEMITKKIGEATVLKVFDIKNLGIIAGSIVREGRFVRSGKVKVYRGKQLVGEGTIRGLQRDRKAVKEVHSGFECGFLVDGFDTWEVDDRVECYQEVPA